MLFNPALLSQTRTKSPMRSCGMREWRVAWAQSAEPWGTCRQAQRRRGRRRPQRRPKNRSEGYNLQNRRPSGNHQKHRQVLAPNLIQAGEAEWFIEACGKTVSHGGARGTIAGSTTARMHWQTIRQQPVLVCSPFIFQVSSPVFFEPHSSLLLCNPVYH